MEVRNITDARVLAAMRTVPREQFVPHELRSHAYDDSPLPIGHEQTISQPYIVALMSQLADIRPGDRVLEIGTGSGYQSAVLAELGAEVYSLEIIEELAERAGQTLDHLGYRNVHIKHDDGFEGWSEAAPFDAIVVTAAPPAVPSSLKHQLKIGASLVIPVGRESQQLWVIKRTDDGYEETCVAAVRFVPMTGHAQTKTTAQN